MSVISPVSYDDVQFQQFVPSTSKYAAK